MPVERLRCTCRSDLRAQNEAGLRKKWLLSLTLAWKWIPCWYASSLWSGTLESVTSSTRLYLFLAGITEGKPTDDTDHSGLHGATVPIPNAPVPCVIPERLQQWVRGGDAVHCCCLELRKVRSSRGARLRASLFIPEWQSRLYFLICGWKRCVKQRKDRVSRAGRGKSSAGVAALFSPALVVAALQPSPPSRSAPSWKQKSKPPLEQSYHTWHNQEPREGRTPPLSLLQQRHYLNFLYWYLFLKNVNEIL